MTGITIEVSDAAVQEILLDALRSRPLLIAMLDRLDTQAALLLQMKDLIMTTKQDILDAAAQEKAEVDARLDALLARIAELQAQIAPDGSIILSQADLQEIEGAIRGIFNAPPPDTPADPATPTA